MLRDLVADADVLVENFRPGVLEKWGLGPDRCASQPAPGHVAGHRLRPNRPVCDRRAFGTLAEAMSGFAHQTGTEDGPPPCPRSASPTASPASPAPTPSPPRSTIATRAGGDGQGQVIDLSLLEPLVGILGPGPSAYDQLGTIARPPRQPLPQQRPPQHLPHQGRSLGRHLRERHLGRRTSHAPRRPRRPRRTALVRLRRRTRRNSDLLDDAVAKWIAARPLHRGHAPSSNASAPRWPRSTTSSN